MPSRLEKYLGDQNTKADILVFIDQHNRAPADIFISKLDRQEKNKIDRCIEEFASRGEILNKQRFRNEGSPIYAFKAGRARIACFFLPNAPKKTLVLTHGYSKQSKQVDRIPKAEWKRAHKVYLEVEENKIK